MKWRYPLTIILLFLMLGLWFLWKHYGTPQTNIHSWKFLTTDSTEVHISHFKGKNIILNFWATWCKPCLKEMPLLDQARQILGDDYIVLLASDESMHKITVTEQTSPYHFTYLQTTLIDKGIRYLPTTYIIDSTGTVRHIKTGAMIWRPQAIADSIRQWLQHPPLSH